MEFRRPGFYGMLLVALVVGSPPVFWNAAHAWITLSHLHDRGRLGTAFVRPFGEFFKFLTAHLGVYSPLVFVCLLVVIVLGWQRAGLRFLFWQRPPGNAPRSPEPDAEKARFLLAFGLPLVVMYALLAFKTAGEPNWTAPGFLSLSILAAALWYERARTDRPTAVFGLVALAVALVASVAVLDTDLLRAAGIPWEYRRDPTARLLGWRATAQAVEQFRNDEERELGDKVFLIANRYQLAAELNFYFNEKRVAGTDHPPVYMPIPQGGSDGKHASALGGWQMAVSKYSKHPDIAADLVVYLTSEAAQKIWAVQGGYTPSIPALYKDADVLAANPFFAQLYDTFVSAVPRPSTVTGGKYNQVSSEFWNAVYDTLAGKSGAKETLAALETKLNRMSRGGKW